MRDHRKNTSGGSISQGGIGGVIYEKKGCDYCYYHYNHKGDVVALTDAEAKLAAYYEYHAWRKHDDRSPQNWMQYATSNWEESGAMANIVSHVSALLLKARRARLRKKVAVALLIAVVTPFLLSLAVRGLYYISLRIQDCTIWAKNYDEAEFKRIHVGMTKRRVLELLGDPLFSRTIPARQTWFYYEGPREEFRRAAARTERRSLLGLGSSSFTYEGPRALSRFEFDSCGKLTYFSDGYLKLGNIVVGLSCEEIRGLGGEPKEIEVQGEQEIYSYTMRGGADSYRVRDIFFDAHGKVTDVIREYSGD